LTALSTFAMLAIMSGCTIALILAFKKVAGRRLSPYFHYYIWLLLVVRLLFPVLPQSRLSLFNVFDNFASLSFELSGEKASELYVIPSEGSGRLDSENLSSQSEHEPSGDGKDGEGSSASPYGVIDTIDTASGYSVGFDIRHRVVLTENLIVYLAWGSVSALFLALGLVKYQVQRRGVLRRVLPCRDKEVLDEAEFILAAYRIKRKVKIYWGDRSMLLGVFSPAVIIDKSLRPKRRPGGATSREYAMVLAHELTHLYRRDNLKNFFYGALSCFYWFNPLVWYAFSHVREDAELLCDHIALSRFGLCSAKYAELLYSSVCDKPNGGAAPAASPAMSKAGRQLICRLSFISARGKKTAMPLKIFSLCVAGAIAALCLTNPIGAVKTADHRANYLIKYRNLLAGSQIDMPEPDSALTVRGFIETVLLALDSADLPLPVRTRIQAMRAAGADSVLEEMIKAPYRTLLPKLYTGFISSIHPKNPITREEAAFLLNAMLLLAQRDELVAADMVPQILSQSDYDYAHGILENSSARRKLEAFFSLKSVYTVDASGNRQYKKDDASLALMQNSPLCVIFPLYSFDPYASRRERIMLLDYTSDALDFNAYQQLASVADAQGYEKFIATVPPLLPQVLPADSYHSNLLGTISDPALKAEIAALYTPFYNPDYPDTQMYILTEQPDESYAAELTIRLLENSSYTYEMMAHDQAKCGFDYLSLSPSILPMREYSFTRDDGRVAVYSMLGKKEFEYLYSLATPEEQQLLRAYFILKDPNDESLASSYREKIIETFRIDTAVYIFDPTATANERAEIDAIIAKYKTDYTSVYALPVKMYEPYRDEKEISQSALTAVRCLQSYGVLDAGDYFAPKAAVTFADAVEMIVRLHSVLLIY